MHIMQQTVAIIDRSIALLIAVLRSTSSTTRCRQYTIYQGCTSCNAYVLYHHAYTTYSKVSSALAKYVH